MQAQEIPEPTPTVQPAPAAPLKIVAPMGGLTVKQSQAAVIMGQGKSCAEAAAVVGVARQTVDKWTHKPAFQKAIDKANADFHKDARRAFTRLLAPTIDALEAGLRGEGSVAQVRAASIVVNAMGLGSNAPSEGISVKINRRVNAAPKIVEP